jgi:cytoskeletal protein CcmA (bactofilin family)
MANVEARTDRAVSETRAGAPEERRMAAWVGKGLLIQGKVTSTENLTIDGRVEGTIELGDHSLTIGAGASVQADLVAQTIVISGAVKGNVLATVKIDLHATAAVSGDIEAPLVTMADGAVVTGKVDVAGRPRSGA